MPPRAARRAVRRAATRASRPPRARAKNIRGANRRTSKHDVQVVEEKPVEVEEKPKEESWLDKLPPVIKPDEELHQRLLKERHEKHLQKVHQYCSLESKGILEFALRSIDIAIESQTETEEITGRRLRQLHAEFREGFLTPEPTSSDDTIEPSTCSIELEPKFSLEVQNYLRFTSDSMWKDLSTFFNCQLNEEIVHDPDPKLNEFLEYLQDSMKLFQTPYHPYDKINFPFTVCIIGPIGTGRTTVCQLLQKVFDVNVVEVIPQPPADNLIRKKKNAQQQAEAVQEVEPPPEYPLQDSLTIKMTDDKTTIGSIAQFISEHQPKGTIVVGYPNTKSQLIMLEKAINSHIQSMNAQKSSVFEDNFKSPRPQSSSSNNQPQASSRSKTPVLNIQGLIFTLNPNTSRERLIDPVTGNVYQEDFLMPCFLDFYDVLPTEFVKKHDEICNRLERVTVNEIPTLTSKGISSMNTFESGCRKNYVTAVIPHCDTIDMMITQLDLFIDALYKKNDKPIVEKPLEHLAHPFELIKPGLCYNAILSWRECLDLFAPTIADQSNLVDIIGNRLNQMTDAAFDRFALFTFTADKRADLCSEFQEKESSLPPPSQQTNQSSSLSSQPPNSNSKTNFSFPKISSKDSSPSSLQQTNQSSSLSSQPPNSNSKTNFSFPKISSKDSSPSSSQASPSRASHSALSLPRHSAIPSTAFSSRLSIPHAAIGPNFSPPRMKTAKTSRSPPPTSLINHASGAPSSSVLKTTAKPVNVIPKANVTSNDLISKRPQTANAQKAKTEKANMVIKKRPQTQQAHVKAPFSTRLKSRLGNTDSDSNADDLEREIAEKEAARNREFSNFFKVIWDLSLQSRDRNLKYVTKVVEKSGLLELVVELRKTPKLIFIALLLRLYYTRWFYENFYELFTPKGNEMEEEAVKSCLLLDEFKIDPIHPPKFDVQSKSLKYNDCMTQQTFSLKNISGFVEEKTNQMGMVRGKSMDDMSSVEYNDDIRQTEEKKNESSPAQNIIENFLKQKSNENNQLKMSKDEIYFNQDKTTSDFSIPPFQSNVSFDDTLKFVDKFFNHYIKNLEEEKLQSNVKSSLHLFKTFSKSVKMKEVVLSEAVTNLNHLVSEYAYTKCSHEMESFSEKFRKMRKTGIIEGNLFEYDFSGIRKENRHLANFSIKHEMPIIVQSIVSFKTVKKIGEILSYRNQKFCNMRSFLAAMKSIVGITELESTAIELCVKVFVCSECFSIKKLLLCFIHYPEEEEIISKLFPDN